jgi:hypothetical protein
MDARQASHSTPQTSYHQYFCDGHVVRCDLWCSQPDVRGEEVVLSCDSRAPYQGASFVVGEVNVRAAFLIRLVRLPIPEGPKESAILICVVV